MDPWLAVVVVTLIICLTLAWAYWFTVRVVIRGLQAMDAEMKEQDKPHRRKS